MTVNDGKGLFDKYGLLNNIKNAMNMVADNRGWARCIAIGETVKMIDALIEGLKKEDEAVETEIKDLRAGLENIGKGAK